MPIERKKGGIVRCSSVAMANKFLKIFINIYRFCWLLKQINQQTELIIQ